LLFTLVYVNDERIYDKSFDHRRDGLFMVQAGRHDRSHRSGSVRQIFTSENNCKGATMTKVAIYAGLFAVLASPLAALATPAAQSSVKADANAVSITGKVSCSRFGIGSISTRKGMSVAQTIQYCVNFQGGMYTLVAGNQIFRLTGDSNQLAKLSGQTVAVAGHLNQDEPRGTSYVLMGTVEATSIAPAKN
jgi:hypothetical protein